MINEIHILDEDMNFLHDCDVSDYDDNGIYYNKTIKYMPRSLRIGIDTLVKLKDCSKLAFEIYIAIFCNLRKNTNVVKLDRVYIKSFTGADKFSVSKAIKELVNAKLIRIIRKDTFAIPIYTAVRGNVDSLIKDYKKLQDDELIKQKEKEEIEKINYLNNKRRNKKLKINKL